MNVVFAGHEHFYERIKPQNGIYYFIEGGSAKLRKGDIRKGGPLTANGFDTDFTFMLAELGKDAMQFQVLSRNGKSVDSGTLRLPEEPKKPAERHASFPLTRACMTAPCTGVSVCLATIACLTTACARPTLGSPVRQPAPQVAFLELWNEPKDIAERNLLWGSSRAGRCAVEERRVHCNGPRQDGIQQGLRRPRPDGREWDIKVGKEVQPEIVLSRILWALGYYQPETYYVTGWQLAGSWEVRGRAGTIPTPVRS